jgi:phage gpG-like protein
MPIEITIQGAEKLEAAWRGFKNSPAMIRKRLLGETNDFANRVIANIRKNYLSGPRPERLGVVTGNLRRSVRFRVVNDAGRVIVTFGTNVPYAAIHEFGGDTGRNHKTHIRRRPFLATGMADEVPAFKERVRSMVAEVAGAAVTGG